MTWRLFALLSVFALGTLRSDIAKVYAPGKEPMLVSGTVAANAAGSGVQQQNGKELASLTNQHSGHNYGDLAK